MPECELEDLNGWETSPEVWETCPKCSGEGGFEKPIQVYERGCGFPHDDSEWAECDLCKGAGGFLCEAAGDNG